MGANGTGPSTSGDGVSDHGIDLDAGADLARAALDLARRFAAGATMWCLAPDWPDHGRHVAVEFVHPVIVGKRALPAISVAGRDPIAALRTSARPGDLLVVAAPGESAIAAAAVERAPAWGLVSVWIGTGRRPIRTIADHTIWVDDDDATGAVPFDGRLVLRYHLLWELTHVCFEHPGLLSIENATCDDDASCITCSDEGRPAEVATLLDDGLVSVRTARGVETIDASLIGDVAPGDLLLIHAGTAIERWTSTAGSTDG